VADTSHHYNALAAFFRGLAFVEGLAASAKLLGASSPQIDHVLANGEAAAGILATFGALTGSAPVGLPAATAAPLVEVPSLGTVEIGPDAPG